MKALKSPLAASLLANPHTAEQLRKFLAGENVEGIVRDEEGAIVATIEIVAKAKGE